MGPRSARAVRGAVAAAVALLAVALLAGCGSDGRVLRPAGPDQTASVSTTAPPSTMSAGGPDGAGGVFDVPPEIAQTTVLIGGDTTKLPGVVATAAPTSAGNSAVSLAPELVAPWQDGGAIDARHTCDGENVSPALRWTAAPAGTAEIAVALTDDDVPGFIHWVIAALDPQSTSLGEGEIPDAAAQALGTSGIVGYFGPCPQSGEAHTYRFTVYFLAQATELGDGAAAADLLAAIRGSAFDSATVTGTYTRA